MKNKEVERLQKLADFADLSSRIYKEKGIHPKDYETMNDYIEVVLSVTATETLVEWEGMEGRELIDPMIENELNKRGEI